MKINRQGPATRQGGITDGKGSISTERHAGEGRADQRRACRK